MERALRTGGLLLVSLSLGATGCSNGDSNDGADIMQSVMGSPAVGVHVPRPIKASAPPGLSSITGACMRPAHLSRHGQAPPTGTVHVVPVFWGSAVDPTIQSSIRTSMLTFAGSDEVGWLKREYAMPALTVDTPVTITPANTSTSLVDTDIQTELGAQINAHVLRAASEQSMYVVHPPPTVSVQNQYVQRRRQLHLARADAAEFPDLGDVRPCGRGRLRR